MMDIGARKIFSEEHDMFRQTARRFFKEEVAPYHEELVYCIILIICFSFTKELRVGERFCCPCWVVLGGVV